MTTQVVSPSKVDTVMPAEWSPHARTWVQLPVPNRVFGEEDSPGLESARLAWTGVANTLAAYEPVTMLVPPEQYQCTRRLLVPGVRILETPLENSWLRDSGPTFVHGAEGEVRAVNWVFNGWGAGSPGLWPAERDVAVGVADSAGVPVIDSPLVQEGGGLHVDGDGTVLLTETVQLDPNRNPGWTRQRVEQEVHARLGTTEAIWLPRGLASDYGDYGTQGHVDMLATFVRPGIVLVHEQCDPGHPDFEVSRQTIELLSEATDARGRRLTVIPVPAPTVREVDGHPVGYSYINHYVANDVVVLGVFDDPRDELAAQLLRRVYRGRQIVMLDARDIFAFGGGVHSITQQEPTAAPLAQPAADRPPRLNHSRQAA